MIEIVIKGTGKSKKLLQIVTFLFSTYVEHQVWSPGRRSCSLSRSRIPLRPRIPLRSRNTEMKALVTVDLIVIVSPNFVGLELA
jgi:hypothetical protein